MFTGVSEHGKLDEFSNSSPGELVMNIGGNLGKLAGDMIKQTKDHEKIAKAMQKELNSAKLPSGVVKSFDKMFKAQSGLMTNMLKGLDATEKMAKDASNMSGKNDDGLDLQLLKDLERSINQQSDIVKKLIKQASK
jgi:hypothetical protein